MKIGKPHEHPKRSVESTSKHQTDETSSRGPNKLHNMHPRRSFSRKEKGPTGGVVKRVFDFSVALTALLFLLPLFIIIAVLVKATSTGPVFFKQRRGGYRGRPFLIYKFRTMRTLDDGRKIQQAERKDPRITFVGAFLRKSSLDEIPQLLNVLLGDMSIVGPRPHAISHDREFARKAPVYVYRFRARPGITGLAQINGSRGLIENEDDIVARANLDVKYVETQSLLGDLRIVIKTAFVVWGDIKAF